MPVTLNETVCSIPLVAFVCAEDVRENPMTMIAQRIDAYRF
jgi:hypothetical protein